MVVSSVGKIEIGIHREMKRSKSCRNYYCKIGFKHLYIDLSPGFIFNFLLTELIYYEHARSSSAVDKNHVKNDRELKIGLPKEANEMSERRLNITTLGPLEIS